ncbi:hypothetical protein AB0B57_28955 [Micromonospora sp. NPDC049101]|uniref:hypothetical protein n=1 Tax=Micromonospora sp. NPDC049101 TaxID=3155032 RepID=UPI0033D2FDCC
MGQLTVSGRDTAYVWVGQDTGGQPDPAAVPLRRTGALLLGPGHRVTAERSASVARTSLPVVVRGN